MVPEKALGTGGWLAAWVPCYRKDFPSAAPMHVGMMMPPSVRRALAISVCVTAATVATPRRGSAQDPGIKILNEFAQLPGNPVAGLVKGPDGTLYGTAVMNPPGQRGGVFSLRLGDDGGYEFRLLHEFSATLNTGSHPYGGLALASDGHLYGTTTEGGANQSGTVFRVTAEGVF